LTVKDKLIVALDVTTADQARQLIFHLKADVGMFKVGSQLFTLTGPQLVEEIIASGNKVFLDLKFHDIPHQVAGAARVAAELGVSLFTIHASGGSEMMRRAVDAVSEAAERKNTGPVRVVAVSVLTSMDDKALNEIGVSKTAEAAVEQLVKLAATSGVHGVVSSPHEAATIRSFTSSDFLIVTPGIRPEDSTAQNEDQKRVATPGAALSAGADFLVVGRPITGASDPRSAAQQIVQEMTAAVTRRNIQHS
jgi:orotidine-5'-phosphate decarboxylase